MVMHATMDPLTQARIAADPRALLLVRAAEGDGAAFGQLARELARPALAVAIRVLGDAAAAEDAVQDAFTRLWREAHRFDPARGSFAGWWRRMLMNCALDSRRRLRVAAPLDEATHVADDGDTPAEAAERRDLARQVQAAASSLPPRQRAALLMFHGDGLTMAEIAVALESTEKAVEGLLLRGRAALKDKLTALHEDNRHE